MGWYDEDRVRIALNGPNREVLRTLAIQPKHASSDKSERPLVPVPRS